MSNLTNQIVQKTTASNHEAHNTNSNDFVRNENDFSSRYDNIDTKRSKTEADFDIQNMNAYLEQKIVGKKNSLQEYEEDDNSKYDSLDKYDINSQQLETLENQLKNFITENFDIDDRSIFEANEAFKKMMKQQQFSEKSNSKKSNMKDSVTTKTTTVKSSHKNKVHHEILD